MEDRRLSKSSLRGGIGQKKTPKVDVPIEGWLRSLGQSDARRSDSTNLFIDKLVLSIDCNLVRR